MKVILGHQIGLLREGLSNGTHFPVAKRESVHAGVYRLYIGLWWLMENNKLLESGEMEYKKT
jgi:hypothetical protein